MYHDCFDVNCAADDGVCPAAADFLHPVDIISSTLRRSARHNCRWQFTVNRRRSVYNSTVIVFINVIVVVIVVVRRFQQPLADVRCRSETRHYHSLHGTRRSSTYDVIIRC